jgi:hypothetical protein
MRKTKMNNDYWSIIHFHYQLLIINYQLALRHFFHLHQVANLIHHTQYLRGSFHFFSSMQFLQTQRDQCLLLALRPVDTAFYLCDLNFFHNPDPLGGILI